MRRVVLKMHVSLDGYVRGPNGDGLGWIFRTSDDALKAWEVETLWRAGTHIMGRSLYEEMAAYWPTSDEEYAPPMNELPKVVFSRTLQRAGWNRTCVASGDLAMEIGRLRQEPGHDILAHGGARFAHALAELGLIDEYRLIVHPVVLSDGLRLFAKPTDLTLVDSRAFPGGALLLTYGRA